jgi:hypothetical protein
MKLRVQMTGQTQSTRRRQPDKHENQNEKAREYAIASNHRRNS